MGYETILTEVDDVGVATITFNRPDQRNAFNFEMDREFHEAMWELDADEAVRAIVVTGAGRAFCAGLDLSAGGDAFGAETHEAHDRELGVDSDTVAHRSAFCITNAFHCDPQRGARPKVLMLAAAMGR